MLTTSRVQIHDFPDEYAGKKLKHVLPLKDRNGDDENASALDGWGKIFDETGATVVTLDPTPGNGIFTIDDLIPSGTTTGAYFWVAGFSDSSGGEGTVRFRGRINIKTY